MFPSTVRHLWWLFQSRGFAGSLFEDARRGRVWVRVFIGGECACVVNVWVVLCNRKKKSTKHQTHRLVVAFVKLLECWAAFSSEKGAIFPKMAYGLRDWTEKKYNSRPNEFKARGSNQEGDFRPTHHNKGNINFTWSASHTHHPSANYSPLQPHNIQRLLSIKKNIQRSQTAWGLIH